MFIYDIEVDWVFDIIINALKRIIQIIIFDLLVIKTGSLSISIINILTSESRFCNHSYIT